MATHEQNEEQREIAEIILEQLRANQVGRVSGKYAMFCWGVHNKAFHSRTTERRGGLSFRVQGRKFEGEVLIELAHNDTYRIKLNLETKASDVYFDQLAEIIDNLVETGE
jgi:hypothetical protein